MSEPLINENLHTKQYAFSSTLDIRYVGPDTTTQRLPTILFFATSAERSLTEAAFLPFINQCLATPSRIFSITLPYHDIYNPNKAMQIWQKKAKSDEDILTPFIHEVDQFVNHLESISKTESIAISGLSRGGLIALLLARKRSAATKLVLFAPLLLGSTSSPEQQDSLTSKLSPFSYLHDLIHHPICSFIGNLDTRVHTVECARFHNELAKEAQKQRAHPLHFSLTIAPSIGRDGHGTCNKSFIRGADWILNKEIIT